MKFLVKATIPVAKGNELVRSPDMAQRIGAVLGAIKAETVFFALANGQRTIYALVEVAGGHELPRIVEPFWLAFGADVEVTPVITQEDMEKAGPTFGPLVQQFG